MPAYSYSQYGKPEMLYMQRATGQPDMLCRAAVKNILDSVRCYVRLKLRTRLDNLEMLCFHIATAFMD